jgi:hypothetical protein
MVPPESQVNPGIFSLQQAGLGGLLPVDQSPSYVHLAWCKRWEAFKAYLQGDMGHLALPCCVHFSESISSVIRRCLLLA